VSPPSLLLYIICFGGQILAFGLGIGIGSAFASSLYYLLRRTNFGLWPKFGGGAGIRWGGGV